MQPDPRNSLINLLLPFGLILGLVLLLSLNAGEPSSAASINPLEEWLKLIIGYLAAIAEMSAAAVIGFAVIRGIFSYVQHFFARSKHLINAPEMIRLQLGRVLALGLEFSVASDILRTAVAPNRQDILNLGAIVLLRTLLNYFLEREIQQAEQSRVGASQRNES